MDFGDTSMILRQDVLRDFAGHGRHIFADQVDPTAATALLAAIRATRRFDDSLFLSEAAFDADPQYTGVNPRPGRNLLDTLADRLAFVEGAPHITTALAALLGEGYEVLNRKVVCGVPARSVPGWLKQRIAGNPVNNLGAYVQPKYRDVTYFYGIDFHQDLIDYKDREADFVTLYVYLHPVTHKDAPLFLLDRSHSLGASVFPHELSRTGPDTWAYRNGEAGEMETRQHILTGPTGYAAMWHACTLHGTQPDDADEERISLRYLFARPAGTVAGIDAVNAGLKGRLSLISTRVDLAANGAAAIKGNVVNQAAPPK
jgi:hypothetical protein